MQDEAECWCRDPGNRTRRLLAPTPIPAQQTFQVGRFLLLGANGQSYTASTKRPLCCLEHGQMRAMAWSPSLIHLKCICWALTLSRATSNIEVATVISKDKVLVFRELTHPSRTLRVCAGNIPLVVKIWPHPGTVSSNLIVQSCKQDSRVQCGVRVKFSSQACFVWTNIVSKTFCTNI